MSPLDRNTEAVLLALCLKGAHSCDRQCGRLATQEMQSGWYPPMCDSCRIELDAIDKRLELDAIDKRLAAESKRAHVPNEWVELRCASRVRRLEQLLRGE